MKVRQRTRSEPRVVFGYCVAAAAVGSSVVTVVVSSFVAVAVVVVPIGPIAAAPPPPPSERHVDRPNALLRPADTLLSWAANHWSS